MADMFEKLFNMIKRKNKIEPVEISKQYSDTTKKVLVEDDNATCDEKNEKFYETEETISCSDMIDVDICESDVENNFELGDVAEPKTANESNHEKIINAYIKVIDEEKIYKEGKYRVGQDGLEPGVYYCWNDYYIQIGRNDSFSSGSWGCDDSYIQLISGKKVVIETGMITPLDNIVYTYNKENYLLPGHTYKVGEEIPGGRYRVIFDKDYIEDDYDFSGQCFFHRIAEENMWLSHEVKAIDGLAETDSRTNYVIIENGKALLVEEGDFHSKGGPETHYNVIKKIESDRKFGIFKEEMMAKDECCFLDGFVPYYCAVKDPIAEIIIQEYFTKHGKVKTIKNLLEDDFSINYKIEIPLSDIDAQCMLCFMLMEKYVVPPASFGFSLADIFRQYDASKPIENIEILVENSITDYKEKNPNCSNETLDTYRRSLERYWKNETEIIRAIDLVKAKVSLDKIKEMKKYMKVFPFRMIENEYYYVSYVPKDAVKQYIGDNCPDYLCYYMYENGRGKKYEKEYRKLILDLKEKGVIQSRWKSEFSLYMLIKSYFPTAIYQYRAEWLDKQSLDIYIPEHKIGIEYQGQQHYEEIDVFNGAEGLKETQKRDKDKKEKCHANNVTLIEWVYTDAIEESKMLDIFTQYNISLPPKQDRNDFYEKIKIDFSRNKKQNKEKEVQRICQYNVEGKYIASYENVEMAARETGVSEVSIRRACSGVRDTGGGFRWRRCLKNEIQDDIGTLVKEEKVNGPRKINQFDARGNLIASYDSVSDAVRKTGINAKSIRETARGKQKQAGGYVWKYLEE